LLDEISEPEELPIAWTVSKTTYADGRAYRYTLSRPDGEIYSIAERTGMLLPTPTRRIDFFDSDHTPLGHLQPAERAPWKRVEHYQVIDALAPEEPLAFIDERWRLVDILLLRLPVYVLRLGDQTFDVRGTRYSPESFYEVVRSLSQEEEPGDEAGEAVSEAELALAAADDIDADALIESLDELELEMEAQAREIEPEPDPELEDESPKPEQLGQIQRPTSGADYVVRTDSPSLEQAPLVLTSLVALIDMELFS